MGEGGGVLAKEANSVFTADTFLIHFCFAAQQREEAKDAAAATSQHGGICFSRLFFKMYFIQSGSRGTRRLFPFLFFFF